MDALERAVRVGIREGEEGRGPGGLSVAVATGVAVSMPVARTFLTFGGSDVARTVAWSAPLALLAFGCTTAGTVLAIRAKTTRRAVLHVLGGTWCRRRSCARPP